MHRAGTGFGAYSFTYRTCTDHCALAKRRAIPYSQIMPISLTPIQESIVEQAVKDGKAASAEEFVTIALRRLQDDLAPDLETRVNMPIGDINRELDKGLAGGATPWEGADAFHKEMLAKHQDVLRGGSTK